MSSNQRSFTVDALRLVAAFGVILIHLAPSTDAAERFTQVFSLFAVPFFFLVSLYFFIKRVAALPVITLTELRLDRILVPYTVWTAVYTLLKVAEYRLRHEALSIPVIDVVFFGGAAVHLYFLPKLLYCQAFALAAILLLRALRARLAGICIAVGALAYGWIGELENYFGFGEALLEGLVYTAAGFLLVRTQTGAAGRQVNFAIGCLAVFLIFTTAYFGFPLRVLDAWEGPLVGYGVAALAFNWRLQAAVTGRMGWLLTSSYGIYLAHFAFLEAFKFALAKAGHPLAPYSVLAKIFLGGVIGLCCLGFIAAARWWRITACLFLGEGGTALDSRAKLAHRAG